MPIPADGETFYGVQLDWEADSPEDYASRLGEAPMVYGEYVPFPLSPDTKDLLSRRVDEIADQGGMLILTLEPHEGLDTVTPEAVEDLASELAEYNSQGVPVFVRFAHEMNGSWYAWGQNPAGYVSTLCAPAFQLVMKPSSVLLRTASSEDSTMAESMARSCSTLRSV